MAFLFPSLEVASISGGVRGEIPLKLFCKTNPRNGISFKPGAIVRSSVKDCQVKVSAFEENLKLSHKFSTPIKPSSPLSSKHNKEEEEKQNYYVNTGYAIRTLREEFRERFYREPRFDILHVQVGNFDFNSCFRFVIFCLLMDRKTFMCFIRFDRIEGLSIL
uniref:Uncharacterized protein n=1 Tax=Nelumbo nucifera TaxID=4432 RepID=A0A822ZN79_NELNU|nr:TPA_asm: hypothetical protein HUJ06_001468 [Nelumbo nucifera]